MQIPDRSGEAEDGGGRRDGRRGNRQEDDDHDRGELDHRGRLARGTGAEIDSQEAADGRHQRIDQREGHEHDLARRDEDDLEQRRVKGVCDRGHQRQDEQLVAQGIEPGADGLRFADALRSLAARQAPRTDRARDSTVEDIAGGRKPEDCQEPPSLARRRPDEKRQRKAHESERVGESQDSFVQRHVHTIVEPQADQAGSMPPRPAVSARRSHGPDDMATKATSWRNVERRLTETEHELRRGSARRREIARVIHELHEAVGNLRERAGAKRGTDKLPETLTADDDL